MVAGFNSAFENVPQRGRRAGKVGGLSGSKLLLFGCAVIKDADDPSMCNALEASRGELEMW